MELCEEIKQYNPSVNVVLMTGYHVYPARSVPTRLSPKKKVRKVSSRRLRTCFLHPPLEFRLELSIADGRVIIGCRLSLRTVAFHFANWT